MAKILLSLNSSAGVVGAIWADNGGEKDKLLFGAFLVNGGNSVKLLKKQIEEEGSVTLLSNAKAVGSYSTEGLYLHSAQSVELGKSAVVMNYISSEFDGKSSIEEQYFLLPNGLTTEEAEKKIKSLFFSKNFSNLPIPLLPEWENDFWKEIAIGIDKLPKSGNLPFEGWVLKLATLDSLNSAVKRSHAKAEFKAKFKRVPQLPSLLAYGNIPLFDFKKWQSFLAKMGGIENFKKLNNYQQEAIVNGFEVFGNEFDPKNEGLVETIHGSSIGETIGFLRKIYGLKGKEELKKVERMFSVLFNKYKNNTSFLLRVISFSKELYEEHLEEILSKKWSNVESALMTVAYDNVPEGVEFTELAFFCAKAGVSPSNFERYISEYREALPKMKVAPRSFPTVSNRLKSGYGWEVLDMVNGNAWTVGLETHCCQHLHSVGGACVRYAYRNPETSGMLRIFNKKGETVAQSFFWIAENKTGARTLVLDNIEALGREVRSSIIDSYKDFAKEILEEDKYSFFNINAITVGHGYSDINLGFAEAIDTDHKYYGHKPSTLGYSDASVQSLLMKKKKQVKEEE